MTDRLAYRVPEVCAMLGISRATLYRRVKSGEIAIYRLGGITLVKRKELERLIEALSEINPRPTLRCELEVQCDDLKQVKSAWDTNPLMVLKKVR